MCCVNIVSRASPSRSKYPLILLNEFIHPLKWSRYPLMLLMEFVQSLKWSSYVILPAKSLSGSESGHSDGYACANSYHSSVVT